MEARLVDEITRIAGQGMSVRDHFESLLDQNPADWTTRIIYADWLEENGEPVLAAGQRWQAINKVYPFKSSDIPPVWVWFKSDYKDRFADIGSLIFERMLSNVMKIDIVYGSYFRGTIFASDRQSVEYLLANSI